VGVDDVADIEKISFDAKVPNLQFRRHKPSFDPRNLRREASTKRSSGPPPVWFRGRTVTRRDPTGSTSWKIASAAALERA
jgi:hypothetical protein